MTILIVEDEMPAAERMRILLKLVQPDATIVALLDSVEDTVAYLRTQPAPDLIIMDIHLSDGSCFPIFKQCAVNTPVIFTTAFNQYAIQTFEYMSVDYILKPVSEDALRRALQKWKQLKNHFTPRSTSFSPSLFSTNAFRNRFVAKVGNRSFFVPTEEVQCFMADDKMVYLIDREGNRYLVNFTMEKLEQMLDPNQFLRISRKYILNAREVEQVRPFVNNRMQVQLRGNKVGEPLIVSRDRVSVFRKWAEGVSA
ncbi:MAG: LytR/AlgR family response regulator transcription factor [Ferruginibacter sp.]